MRSLSLRRERKVKSRHWWCRRFTIPRMVRTTNPLDLVQFQDSIPFHGRIRNKTHWSEKVISKKRYNWSSPLMAHTMYQLNLMMSDYHSHLRQMIKEPRGIKRDLPRTHNFLIGCTKIECTEKVLSRNC